jgi:hypothetical protein
MKDISIVGFIIIFLGFTKLVNADDEANLLNPLPSASKYYQVECFDDGHGDAAYLEVTLLTTSKAPPIVSLQVKTDAGSIPFTVTNITDPNNNDSRPSRTVQIANNSAVPYATVTKTNNANGFYYIAVNKTKAGKQSFHFTYHCMGVNAHTGTNLSPLQQ